MKTLEESGIITDGDAGTLREIKRVIAAFLPGASVVLYGSVARGEQGPESDYDVLILVDAPLTRQEERAIDNALWEIELAKGIVISTAYWTRRQWAAHPAMPFHVEVERHGVAL